MAQGFVINIAINFACGAQMHLSRANGAIDTPANGNGFARQLASYMGVLADRHGMRAQIAVKNAVNLNIAG